MVVDYYYRSLTYKCIVLISIAILYGFKFLWSKITDKILSQKFLYNILSTLQINVNQGRSQNSKPWKLEVLLAYICLLSS